MDKRGEKCHDGFMSYARQLPFSYLSIPIIYKIT